MASSDPQTSPTRTRRAERTRQRIIDAAGKCFANGGYAKTTVEEVATQAGVSKALVYHHFGSKAQILDAVVERTLAEWEQAYDIDSLVRGGAVLDAITKLHHTGLACARSNPALHALLELDSRVLFDAAAGQAVRASVGRLRAALVAAVGAGIAAGELRDDILAERAAEVILIHHLALIQHILDPEWVEVSDGLVECGIDILLRGLARRPEP